MTEIAEPTELEPGSQSREVVVGVLADPDLPTAVADRLEGSLGAKLPEQLAHVPVRWRIEVARDAFEMHSGYERLLDRARERVHTSDWNLAVCLTDAPLRDAHGVVLAEIGGDDSTAVVSLPAIGGVDVVRRTRRLVAILVEHLAAGVLAVDGTRSELRGDRRLRRARALHVVNPSETDIGSKIVLGYRLGLARLLLGMTRANRPWRLAWGLSAALGGSLAGSAFGVLYSSIWMLADSLSEWRIVLVCVGAIAIYVLWLITSHGLWQTPITSTRRDDVPTILRNLSTLLTVTLGALVFFTVLFAGVLVACLLVITPDYLATNLGHPSGFGDYLDTALMATVMGMVAGAVGSGLEDDTTIRQATYGYRERQRVETETS
ncbi:hypothetical protein [Pseudonocardia parietis]|uniref:Uncharacterized protein n=1 Tax=Pseudonocardia parietis TaxID=570936 RepID=A0ABS4VVC2_9PSEU|nr:hypothetical protein [Pseudonocardia parietis]MBP2367880.1 hypothetical protein [Pseudonocardia parietis]